MYSKANYHALYDYLEGFEKCDQNEILEQICNEWTSEQIENFVIEISKMFVNDFYETHSYYNFLSNSSLAGGDFPCAALACRMRNVGELARFAALYADKVLLPSPIDEHISAIENHREINRYNLAVDIIILLYLKPLVLAGIIGFISSQLCLCENCLKTITKKEDELREKIDRIYEMIRQESFEKIGCTLSRDEMGVPFLAINGAEEFGYHDKMHILVVPNNENADIIKLLEKTSKVVFTKKQICEWGIIDYLIDPFINDVFRAQVLTMGTNSSYLTGQKCDATIISKLQEMGKSSEMIEEARMIENGLFHNVPIVGEVDVKDVVELRMKDGESFAAYRSKMNSILDGYDCLDRNTINDIQKDIIFPQLDSIESTISRNRKALVKSAARDVALIGGGLSIGMITGILPLDYAGVIGTVGGLTGISAVAQKLGKAMAKEGINDNFFFLYELKKKYTKK